MEKAPEPHFVDRSLMMPYFRRYFRWIHSFIPWAIPANMITLLSAGVMWVLVLAICESRYPAEQVCMIALFCIHFHTVGDQVDGMQAVRTKTCSPLGGFLDHYCDCYTGSIIVLSAYYVIQQLPLGLMLFVEWLCLMAFVVTYVEELKTDRLIFGTIGPLEAELIMMVFFLTSALPVTRSFWVSELVNGYSNFWIIAIIAVVGFAWTIISACYRMKGIPRQFIVSALTSLVLAIALSFQESISPIRSWLVLTFYGANCLCGVMRGRMLGNPLRYPDLTGTVAALALSAIILFHLVDNKNTGFLLNLLLVYLSARAVIDFIGILTRFRQYWHWSNPRGVLITVAEKDR